MADDRRTARGGFRATLALLISIIALIVAFIAFERTGGNRELNLRIQDLQTKIETMKKETAKRMDTIRQQTAEALEKVGRAIGKE
ncbi:MAG: hypothetical protein JRJ26_07525 [Deltaproteobacteria bacterium]|nr:hypothetical protein [Deltaproteobacteria bacterium]